MMGFFILFFFQLQHSVVVWGAWSGTQLSGRPEFIFYHSHSGILFNSFLQRQEGKIHRLTLTVVSENQCFQEIRDCFPPRVFIIPLNIRCSQELFCKWPHFHISYGIIIFKMHRASKGRPALWCHAPKW